MKTFDELVAERRSIRSFRDEPVAREDLMAICETARLAPSACNSQTWRFIAVSERRVIERICREAMQPVIRNSWLSTAPLLIVGCSQMDLVANYIGTKVTGIDYYQIDLGIAMEHMVLKAADLGLGTCWIGWFKEKKVKEILEIPDKIRVSAMLAVGRPACDPVKRKSRKPIHEILFFEKWGRSE